MNVLILFLAILITLFIWVLLGFVAFLVAVRRNKYKEFSEATEDFKVCLLGGGLTFIIMLSAIFKEKFFKIMDWIINKINSK